MHRKRLSLGVNEIQRIVWLTCAFTSSAGANKEGPNLPIVPPEFTLDATAEDLQRQIRRRRKRLFDYCMAQRNLIHGSSRTALAILQGESIQGLFDTAGAMDEFSRWAGVRWRNDRSVAENICRIDVVSI